jgi:hypothetical protein
VKLAADLFARYAANPLALDSEVRQVARVPEDRYYTVAVWPEHLAGVVSISQTGTRHVAPKKISKSNQPA